MFNYIVIKFTCLTVVLAAAVDFPTQAHVTKIRLRIEPHKPRDDGRVQTVLHNSLPVVVSAKDAITAIIIACDIIICHAVCAVGELV